MSAARTPALIAPPLLSRPSHARKISARAQPHFALQKEPPRSDEFRGARTPAKPDGAVLVRDFPMRYYVWTLIAMLAVAAPDVWAALQPPVTPLVQSAEYSAHHPLGETPTMLTLAEITKDGHTRSPASIEGPTTPTVVLDEVADFKIPCKGELKTSFAKTVTQVRLSGETCSKRALASAAIENTTNGFSATIFPQPPRGYSTDYISLARGGSEISITLKFKDGTEQHKVLTVGQD